MTEEHDLRDLLNTQKLAVLGTQEIGRPYSCLVAFAMADDLKYLVFATRRDTRKFREATANPSVAMLIDSRSNAAGDFENAVAVTALGRAAEPKGDQSKICVEAYITKHPELASFVRRDDVALLQIDIEEYVIARFDATRIVRP